MIYWCRAISVNFRDYVTRYSHLLGHIICITFIVVLCFQMQCFQYITLCFQYNTYVSNIQFLFPISYVCFQYPIFVSNILCMFPIYIFCFQTQMMFPNDIVSNVRFQYTWSHWKCTIMLYNGSELKSNLSDSFASSTLYHRDRQQWPMSHGPWPSIKAQLTISFPTSMTPTRGEFRNCQTFHVNSFLYYCIIPVVANYSCGIIAVEVQTISNLQKF